MIIRRATEVDRDEYYKLVDYCFEYPHAALKAEMKLFNADECIIYEDDNKKIMGGMMIYPHFVTYGIETVPMGGISIAVAHPTIRYSGYTGKLIKYAIEYMHDKGMVFSMLEPFLYKFYRSYGWELTYDKLVYEMEIDAFKTFLNTDYSYRLCDKPNLDEILIVHNQFVARYSGAVHRDVEIWEKLVKIVQKMGYYLCTCSIDNIVKGYMIYKINDEVINVREIIWDNIQTYKALLGYIYRHNSQCEKVTLSVPTDDPCRLLIEEPNRRIYLHPVMMGRIINVKKSFEKGCYQNNYNQSLILKINDKYAEWNNGYWQLDIDKGSITANMVNAASSDAEIDIQSLTQLLLGYCSAKKLYEIDKLKVYNKDIKKILFGIFTSKCTFMNQKF